MFRSVLVIFILIVGVPCSAQFLGKLNKGTSKREIRKRQEEADKKSSYNKFNKLQPMGKKATLVRNDFLWSYSTANVVPDKGGDISLLFPSRISLGRSDEIGGSIGTMLFVPNLYYKKRWHNNKFMIASKHQLYSYTPLLYLFDRTNSNAIQNANSIPNTIALKNELIFSMPFLKEINCGATKEPYLIISAAIAIDFGIRVNQADSISLDNKFLTPRSGAVVGNNIFGTVRLQADYMIYNNLFLSAGIRGILSDNTYSNAIEHNAHVKYSLSPKVSVSAGYWLTLNTGGGTPILPIIDISYHFGLREGRSKGLFSKKGYNTLK